MFGVVRFDFILDKNGNVYINEVNTIPGSLANYLYKDFDYKSLLDKSILSALIRYDESKKFINDFNSGVLLQGMDGLKK